MATDTIKQENAEIEPTGGWLQYKLATFVLTLYPIFMLGAAFILLYAWPVQNNPTHTEVVSTTSHEPFHLSLNGGSPQEVGRVPLAYGPTYPR